MPFDLNKVDNNFHERPDPYEPPLLKGKGGFEGKRKRTRVHKPKPKQGVQELEDTSASSASRP